MVFLVCFLWKSPLDRFDPRVYINIIISGGRGAKRNQTRTKSGPKSLAESPKSRFSKPDPEPLSWPFFSSAQGRYCFSMRFPFFLVGRSRERAVEFLPAISDMEMQRPFYSWSRRRIPLARRVASLVKFPLWKWPLQPHIRIEKSTAFRSGGCIFV